MGPAQISSVILLGTQRYPGYTKRGTPWELGRKVLGEGVNGGQAPGESEEISSSEDFGTGLCLVEPRAGSGLCVHLGQGLE